MSSGDNNQQHCVYTVLLGGYEELNEQEVAYSSDIPFICITDDRTLRCKTWDIHPIEPILPADLPRSSRFPKICAHKFFPDYASSLYIDNSVILKRKPEDIFHDLLHSQRSNMACLVHPYRTSLLDEIGEVVRLGLDDTVRCFEQVEHYLISGWQDTENLIAGSLLLRNHNEPEVIECMERWFYHVLRYSRRDQTSFNFVANSLSFSYTAHALDLRESPYHVWPRAQGRERQQYVTSHIESIKPSVLRTTELVSQRRQAQEELVEARAKVKKLEDAMESIRNSTSWRIAVRLEQLSLRRPALTHNARRIMKMVSRLKDAWQSLRRKDGGIELGYAAMKFCHYPLRGLKHDLLVITASDDKMKAMAHNLQKTCHNLGYEIRIYRTGDVPAQPLKKITFKPLIVRKALCETKQDIVWIDADCLVIGSIHKVLTDCDVAVTLRRSDESKDEYKEFSGYLNSGVIFFRNCPASRAFVELWISELPNCEFYLSDQEALNRVVFKATDMTSYDKVFEWKGIRMKILRTDEYNFFYFPDSCKNAKILHFKEDKRQFYDSYVSIYCDGNRTDPAGAASKND